MQREYGIDMLKIVAMLFIVADHILLWGGWGFCAGQLGVKGHVLELLDAICLCHVNCFVLASGWIMSRLEFKFKRIVKLWLEVWGYSLVFLLIWLCFPNSRFSMKAVMTNLLPIIRDRYWFFTQYTILFFAMPLLNAAIKNLDLKILSKVLIAGFFCFSLHPFAFKADIFNLKRGYSALWFMYLYLFAGTMSVKGLFQNVKRSILIGLIVFAVIGGVAMLHIRGALLSGIELSFDPNVFRAYNCPFILLYSVALLLLFSNVNVSSNRARTLIAMVAPSVFAVYVIHSNPLFRGMTNWNVFWGRFLDGHSTLVCAVGTISSAMLIFVTCILIDYMRKRIWARVLPKLTSCIGGR